MERKWKVVLYHSQLPPAWAMSSVSPAHSLVLHWVPAA